METEQIIKKEDGLRCKTGFMALPGALVLTNSELYFLVGNEKKSKKTFLVQNKDIVSINIKKGIGHGIHVMSVVYKNDGDKKEKSVKIIHQSFMSGFGLGSLSRLEQNYFESWEKTINDTRFNKNASSSNSLNDLEKLGELRQKGILTEEEFNQKKKQILNA